MSDEKRTGAEGPEDGGSTRRRQRRSAPGTSPGRVAIDPLAPPSNVAAFLYGPDTLQEEDHTVVGRLGELVGRVPVLWVDVQGLGDAAVVESVGATFDVHPLALEDVINVGQRPKIEEYGDTLFIVTRMLREEGPADEQLAIVMGADFVVTFQEQAGDAFRLVRERIRRGGSRIRSQGTAYLVYALLDAVTDAFFPLLERYTARLEAMEQEVLERPRPELIPQLYELRRGLTLMRRDVWPLRELLGRMMAGHVAMVSSDIQLYLRDCHDHAHQILDSIDDARDQSSGLADAALALSGQKMNEIMTVLTVIAAVFIPLSFIAGVYGMNFDPSVSSWNMPELDWRWGYPAVLLLMLSIALVQLYLFWRKGIIGRRKS